MSKRSFPLRWPARGCNTTSEVSTEHRGTLQTISWTCMHSPPRRLHAARCTSTHRNAGKERSVGFTVCPAQPWLIRIRPSVHRSINGRGREASQRLERGPGRFGAWGPRWTPYVRAPKQLEPSSPSNPVTITHCDLFDHLICSSLFSFFSLPAFLHSCSSPWPCLHHIPSSKAPPNSQNLPIRPFNMAPLG